jgi:3-oxoacid CoA-transferase subunit A/glutaconate CoA-transferase subunit A
MCHINVLSSESAIESSSVSVWKKRATKDRCPYHFQLRNWWRMKILGQGRGRLLAWRDPDDQRRWVLMNKPRRIEDKRVNLSDAVAKYVRDGDYIAMGGFGHVRVSMASVYEIIRQRKRKLTMVGKPGVHDFDLLIASGCVSIVEVAYGFGHELRGLSRASRRAAETGRLRIGAEISNAGIQWRLKAGAMGLSFIPTRVMLGSDTFWHSSAKVVNDPFTGKPVCLLPACCPDVAFIHVHRCDKYGNSQIDGATVMDSELSRAARRLIVTTEEIVSEAKIRKEPWKTQIPYYLVDAVVKIPFGSHPGNMPYLYYFDEKHIAEWLKLSESDQGVEQYLRRYVYDVNSFDQYLERVGGTRKLRYLRKLELQETRVRPDSKRSMGE